LGGLWSDYTFRTAILGCAILGLTSGVLGCFATLRRQSLMGDAMSHAALPGVALAFILTGSKSPWALMLGAAASGGSAMLLIMGISAACRIDRNTVLGAMLTTFFGLGVVAMSWLQANGTGSQAGLDKFLFGQAAALVAEDVAAMSILSAAALAVAAAFHKEFKLVSFDPGFARSIGLPVAGLGAAISALLLAAIVIGLNAVGVVLMSAMLVGPASAARQWTSSLERMLVISGSIGAGCAAAGAAWSGLAEGVPTGPAIVLILTAVVIISLLAGSDRGWIVSRWRRARA
jgi:manganese/zinc/iron transport system permease protein